ncbi:MAG: class I SAM-dependent methyltransferase [Myxococcota bacterium]|nr:class I SAM-dependent methyltransferase [Myxococcota bacterium]
MESDAASSGAEPSLQGQLFREGQQIPVTVGFASRISLHVAFPGPPPPDRTVFEKLTLQLGERVVELSSCRLHVEYTRVGFAGRLVFLEDVYDCRALLFDKKYVDLKAFFHNLPLVLSQKERIHPEFRDYTAAALYDLAVYKRFFNEQDRIYANEPQHVADAAQEALIRSEGKRFFEFFNRQLDDLSLAVAGFDKEEHERHGYYFRRQAWEFILGSELLKRTNLKPRGYAGDAEIMQMLYENRYVGNYVFNKLMHKHPADTAASQAVRNRRQLVPKVLRRVAQESPVQGKGAFRVLSLACGPAWELRDVFQSPEEFERYYFAVLDQDPHALECARNTVQHIESTRGNKIQIDYFSDSVRTMLRTRKIADRFGRYHFIYSMGLFDYLTPPVARATLSKMFDLLLPGGTMLVGNFHAPSPDRIYMEYWADWVLYYRSEEEMLELVEKLPGAKPRVFFEETGVQMFLELQKQG